MNPALGSFTIGENGSTSRYNSLQASLDRRLTHNLQAQVSYTYSKCISDGDSALASLSGNAPTVYENPYNREYDKSICGFNVTQASKSQRSLQLALPWEPVGGRLAALGDFVGQHRPAV